MTVDVPPASLMIWPTARIYIRSDGLGHADLVRMAHPPGYTDEHPAGPSPRPGRRMGLPWAAGLELGQSRAHRPPPQQERSGLGELDPAALLDHMTVLGCNNTPFGRKSKACSEIRPG